MGKFSSITELWQNKQKPISIIHSSKKRQKKNSIISCRQHTEKKIFNFQAENFSLLGKTSSCVK
jgi:hypothetical protein